MEAHKHGLSSLIEKAKEISRLKEKPEEAELDKLFELEWELVLDSISSGSKVLEVQTAYKETLSKTFKGVNKLMPDIKSSMFETIVKSCKDTGEQIEDLPKALKNYLVKTLKTGCSD